MADVSSTQRVMAGVYRPPLDSAIHADIGVDAEVLERTLARLRAKGRRVTLTALVTLAAGHALRENPDCNIVWSRGRWRPRQRVSTWVYSTTDEGHVTGARIDHEPLPGLDKVQAVLDKISRRNPKRRGGFAKRMYSMLSRRSPGSARRWLRVWSWWLHDIRGRNRLGGLDADGFGAVGISNVGSIGIPTAPAIPMPPHARHVLLVSVGSILDRPVIRDGEVVAGRWLPVTAVLDHRAFVGVIAARIMASFQQALTDQELLDHLVEAS